MAAKVVACTARVEAVRSLTCEIREVDLRMEDPPEFRFDAGQWVSVPFGPKTVRAYSMASAPSLSKHLTLSADLTPGGIGSRWFGALKPGDLVEFKGPAGGFVFTRADPRWPLFVAEEIGIVPIRSILWDLYQTGFGRPATLIYWTRDPSWLTYDQEFRVLSRRYPGFTYIPVVREATKGWTGDKAEPEDVVERTVSSVEGSVAYVAGGSQMISRVRDVLVKKGLDRKSVKWEKLW
ncbi:MAG: FAD-binding oxidoreductase [Candidatus Methylomirabilia bacterium]